MAHSDSEAAADTPLPGPVSAPIAVDADDGETHAAELESLFRRHEARLGAFLAQVIGDRSHADDLVQETFLTAVKERRRLPTIENPEAWLFAIARHRALHALRTRRRAWNALQRLARERRRHDPDPGDAVAVRDYLARHLKPEERVLLVLRYVHGYRSAELAKIVGRSPEAIRQELFRVTRKLKATLDQDPMQVNDGSER
jgi:RNA polymerase sigma-70 factor (ECF subfamily)